MVTYERFTIAHVERYLDSLGDERAVAGDMRDLGTCVVSRAIMHAYHAPRATCGFSLGCAYFEDQPVIEIDLDPSVGRLIDLLEDDHSSGIEEPTVAQVRNALAGVER